MSIPTYDQVLNCTAHIWQTEEYQRDILWAGLFGSVGRNQHIHNAEPVDLRENLAEACGRKIDLMCIWQGPDWAWGNTRIEALLSSRTLYGDRRDVEHLRLEALTIVVECLERLNCVADAVEKIKTRVASAKTCENFIQPDQEAARQECGQELRKIVSSLDIPSLHHPTRSMLFPPMFDYTKQISALLDQILLSDITAETAPVCSKIWDHMKPRSPAMWLFENGCSWGGRTYIRHMLASKKLADTFEEGGQVDDSMYREISR